MNLEAERCEACQPGSPQVANDEIDALLAEIPGWSVVEIGSVKRLKRVFRVDEWNPAVDFANRVAQLAAEANHHPSIRIEWGKVTVQWWTHAIGGLHRNDFIMAAQVNNLIGAR